MLKTKYWNINKMGVPATLMSPKSWIYVLLLMLAWSPVMSQDYYGTHMLITVIIERLHAHHCLEWSKHRKSQPQHNGSALMLWYFTLCTTTDILDYVNRIGNGCMFAQSSPPLIVGTEMSILTTPIHFSVDRPREIDAMAAGLPQCKLIPATRTTI